MKNKIILFSAAVVLAAGFTACSGDHAVKPGQDSTGHNIATNPYRDTFATTSTYGNATTVDNSGGGGIGVAKPKASGVPSKEIVAAPAAAPADTAVKK